jgi:carbonic anhydrase
VSTLRACWRRDGASRVSETDRLLENARTYVEGFAGSDLAAPPSKRVAVLACMDARLIPSRVLGLAEGEAHILRNAGGVVTEDAIRSLSLSQHLLGTEEIVLIHHTDCGMLKVTDEEFAAKLEQETGRRPEWSAEAFSDLEQDVRDSIARLEESPFIPHKDSIRGFVYDVKTGELREVT